MFTKEITSLKMVKKVGLKDVPFATFEFPWLLWVVSTISLAFAAARIGRTIVDFNNKMDKEEAANKKAMEERMVHVDTLIAEIIKGKNNEKN